MTQFHSLEMETLDGQMRSLSDFQGQHCLIVNVASR